VTTRSAVVVLGACLLVAATGLQAAAPDAQPPPQAAPPLARPSPPPADVSETPPDLPDIETASLGEELARETARAQAFLAALQEFDERLEHDAGEEQVRSTEILDRVAGLAVELQSSRPGSPEADRLYWKIVAELKLARARLREALDAIRAPSTVPSFEPRFLPGRLDSPTEADRIAALQGLYAEIRTQRARLIGRERERRWDVLRLRATPFNRLDAMRIEALPRLSPAERSRILGITQEGIAQLGREIEHLTLSAHYYAVSRLHEFESVPRLLHNVFAVGTATYVLLRIGIVLALILFLRRRGARLLAGTRRLLFGIARGVRWTRRVDRLLATIQVVAPWAFFLLSIRALIWALGDASRWPEAQLSYRIALLYGLYRLAIDVLVALTVAAARRYRLRLDAQRRSLVFTSIRIVMRVVVAIGVLLAVSERLLGRGYLYHVVVNLAWIVALGSGLRLLARWRGIISDAYLGVSPQGTLARLVRSTRERWYGVAVAAASFLWLAGRAGLVVARDFALGFDQTRRALAFLFRRRIQKHAERQGYSEGRVEELPPALVRAFSEEAVTEGPLVVDHFPGLDRLAAALQAWRGRGAGGTFLLCGERGMGKTSWLGRVPADGLPVTRLPLSRRVRTEAGLAELLVPALLSAPGPSGGLADLERDLNGGAPRLVIVDLMQNLFLSAIGGYAAFERFVSLLDATCGRVFWLCAINSYAWDHLTAVRPELAVFRHRQELPPWSEEGIRELIRARTAASGVDLTYEDLVFEEMEGVSAQARLLQTEEGYTRLLWDYSDGNPRVALHYWLQSLVSESERRARVRLFIAPAAEELEAGGTEGLFVLAAIVMHENLTLAETVLTTRLPEALCRIHLARFADLGALRVEERERYRVTAHWHRAVVRLLKRRNLLQD
jgi:hypothetical protein